MAKQENPPFDRGTYQDAGTYNHLLGREYEIEDEDWGGTTGAKQTRSGKLVTLRVVQNLSGIALLPKHVVRYSTVAGNYGHAVDGDVSASNQDWAGVVDEYLPAAGVPNNSIFYIVVLGPSKVITPDAAGGFTGAITVGALLAAATAAASTGTTGGRVAIVTTEPIQNAVGRALQAATTGNTATDVMADVGRW